MSLVKAFGIPTGAPLTGGQFTPPHYGRTDYNHRWAANTLRGTAGAPTGLPDITSAASLAKAGTGLSVFNDHATNPAVTLNMSPTAAATLTTTTTEGKTHASIWCVNLTANMSQALRTPGRVYGTTASGALNAFGTTGVAATRPALGWHVIALTSTPSGFSVWVDGVKDGDYTGPAGTQNLWGVAPTTSSGTVTVQLGEAMTFDTTLPDADLVAISQAMMRERGL